MAVGDITHAEKEGILLTATLVLMYTVPANRVLISLEIWLLNVSAATTYYPEVQLIPTGQLAGDRYKIIAPDSDGGNGMVAGESRSYSMNPMAAAGAFIQAREITTINVLSFRAGMTLKEV